MECNKTKQTKKKICTHANGYCVKQLFKVLQINGESRVSFKCCFDRVSNVPSTNKKEKPYFVLNHSKPHIASDTTRLNKDSKALPDAIGLLEHIW